MPVASCSTTLATYFEGKQLFAAAWLGKLKSPTEARALLEGGLGIHYDGKHIVVQSDNRSIYQIDTFTSDDLGCWSEGVDRTSHDEYLASCVPEKEFLSRLPQDKNLELRWWAITEYVHDETGKVASMKTTTSECIGIPAKH